MGRPMQKGVLNNKDMEYTYSRIQVDMPSMYMSRGTDRGGKKGTGASAQTICGGCEEESHGTVE